MELMIRMVSRHFGQVSHPNKVSRAIQAKIRVRGLKKRRASRKRGNFPWRLHLGIFRRFFFITSSRKLGALLIS